jgi:hypothetical protein
MNMSLVRNSKSFVLATLFAAIAALSTSCGDGSSARNITIPGVDGPKVTLNQDNVLIAMVFENIQLDGGLRYAIPKYKKSYIEISPDLQSAGTLMAISVSLDDVFGGALNNLDPQTLPGGRALPGVASGRLPAVAFSIEKFKNVSFYLGPKLFGVFIPVKNLGIGNSMLTARYYIGSDRAGNISLVGEDLNGENAGILLMLDMDASVQKKLKSIAKKY